MNTELPQYIQISKITNGWLVGVQKVRLNDCSRDSQYCFTDAASLGKAIENLATYGTITVPAPAPEVKVVEHKFGPVTIPAHPYDKFEK
jgi:hypothetical protein